MPQLRLWASLGKWSNGWDPTARTRARARTRTSTSPSLIFTCTQPREPDTVFSLSVLPCSPCCGCLTHPLTLKPVGSGQHLRMGGGQVWLWTMPLLLAEADPSTWPLAWPLLAAINIACLEGPGNGHHHVFRDHTRVLVPHIPCCWGYRSVTCPLHTITALGCLT